MSISEAQFAMMTKGTQHEHHAKTPEPPPTPKLKRDADDFDYSIYHKAFKMGLWYVLLTNPVTWGIAFFGLGIIGALFLSSWEALSNPATWFGIVVVLCLGALALLWDFVRNNPV